MSRHRTISILKADNIYPEGLIQDVGKIEAVGHDNDGSDINAILMDSDAALSGVDPTWQIPDLPGKYNRENEKNIVPIDRLSAMY